MITNAIQDYVKAIYKLSASDENVTTNSIADRLHVSQASVTGMIKKLHEIKLIRHKPYQGVELTEGGKKVALEIIRHHRLIELYLAEAMGYSWDQVHEEAEKLEHVISEQFEEKMAQFLGDPTVDPHGAPIPTKEGTVEERDLKPLTLSEAGQKVRVKQVSDKDPDMLRYLGKLGIYPGVIVDVVEKVPFEGPILVQVGKSQHHLGQLLTDKILVSAA